jgi:hypothetical protein
MGTTVNDMEEREKRNWGDDPRRAPTLQDGDTMLYSECGRVIKNSYGHKDGIDYRSHYFTLVKREFGGVDLLVKHGGGEERFQLDYSKARATQFFEPLDSTQRYLLMHLFYNVNSKAKQRATEETANRYRTAFAKGALKKRKVRGSDNVKVWIDNVAA